MKRLTNNDLIRILNTATQGALKDLLPPDVPTRKGVLIEAAQSVTQWFARGRDNAPFHDERVIKALQSHWNRQIEAERQGAVVNAMFSMLGAYQESEGIADKTGHSFAILRRTAHGCPPVGAIQNTRIRQTSRFSRKAVVRLGRVERPGWHIRLTDVKAPLLSEDEAAIADLDHFIENTGYIAPPREERPLGWQPGFGYYLEQIARDSLILDWAVTRRWKPADKRFWKDIPLVSFCAVDSARHLRAVSEVVDVQNGVPVLERFKAARETTQREIKFVKMSDAVGGVKIMEFDGTEMCAFVRNIRTDEEANGYGYSEEEQALDLASMFMMALEYNGDRFNKDSLPRGFLTLLGNIGTAEMRALELQLKQLFEGRRKRWGIPVIRGAPGQGSVIKWDAIDLNSRDMEYHQFMFLLCIYLHALYGIHPDETGLEALSPMRPPLSEASPEVKLKFSQDSGFEPFMRKLEGHINHEILWKRRPDRRYTFEWRGLGEQDALQDEQVIAQMLANGTITPRMVWDARDLKLPKALEDAKWMDLNMPPQVGAQLLMQMDQAAQQQQQQAQQQQMAQEQQAHQQGLDKLQAFQQASAQQDEDGAGAAGGNVPYGKRGRVPAGGNGNGQSAGAGQPEVVQKALLYPWV